RRAQRWVLSPQRPSQATPGRVGPWPCEGDAASVDHLGDRHDLAAGRLEARAHVARHRDGGRLVAMHANRLDRDVHPVSLSRCQAAIAHHAEALRQRLVWILEDGSWDRTRAEVAVVLVVAVGEAFARQAKAQLAG